MSEAPTEPIATAIKQAEGKALKRIWDLRRPMPQARFAQEVLHRSAGYLPAFFSGERPLTLWLARIMAGALDCKIAEFSPRLAAEDDAARSTVEWPFETVSYVVVAALEPWDRAELEGAIRSWFARRAVPSAPSAAGGRGNQKSKR